MPADTNLAIEDRAAIQKKDSKHDEADEWRDEYQGAQRKHDFEKTLDQAEPASARSGRCRGSEILTPSVDRSFVGCEVTMCFRHRLHPGIRLK